LSFSGSRRVEGELAEGVDDDTWGYRLGRGDYSSWMRDTIKDEQLAAEVSALETDSQATDSRRRVVEAVRRRYAV
jgi:hypothetical protein